MTKNAKHTLPVVIIGVVGIIIIELYALSKGINGIALTLSIGAITALAGGKVGQFFGRRDILKDK